MAYRLFMPNATGERPPPGESGRAEKGDPNWLPASGGAAGRRFASTEWFGSFVDLPIRCGHAAKRGIRSWVPVTVMDRPPAASVASRRLASR